MYTWFCADLDRALRNEPNPVPTAIIVGTMMAVIPASCGDIWYIEIPHPIIWERKIPFKINFVNLK